MELTLGQAGGPLRREARSPMVRDMGEGRPIEIGPILSILSIQPMFFGNRREMGIPGKGRAAGGGQDRTVHETTTLLTSPDH